MIERAHMPACTWPLWTMSIRSGRAPFTTNWLRTPRFCAIAFHNLTEKPDNCPSFSATNGGNTRVATCKTVPGLCGDALSWAWATPKARMHIAKTTPPIMPAPQCIAAIPSPVVASGEIAVFCTRWQWQMPILACASGQGKAGDGNAALLAKLPLDNRMRLAYL